jgi:Domain of unknown function (DUF1876)/Domain of unknown function (DUF1918)
MSVNVGDRLKVRGRVVGQPAHAGEILEVLGSRSAEHYRVKWDDGHVSTVFPGSDSTIERTHVFNEWGEDGRRVETRSATIVMRIDEDDARCDCVASLSTDAGVISGRGVARRHPYDPVVPMIGEELAVARALRSLADQLEVAARRTIGSDERSSSHLVS